MLREENTLKVFEDGFGLVEGNNVKLEKVA
jgi:hypothetical protein